MQTFEELQFVMNMSDEEITARALSDPDNPPLTEEQLKGFVRLSDYEGNTFTERLASYRKSRAEAALLETSLPSDSDKQEKAV